MKGESECAVEILPGIMTENTERNDRGTKAKIKDTEREKKMCESPWHA